MSATPDVVPHWIGGARTRGASTRTAPVYDPATGAVEREVALADVAD
jgi:malonate-semialdehyde dehydrogenase (acetylating)/methylmalonate-semialdehyde dehydrogenase